MKNTILSVLLLVSFSAMAIETSHERGYRAFEQGNYQEAKVLFSQAIKEQPNNAELYYNRALAESKLNQSEEAKKDFQTAINLIK